ncbi:unnamed protein product [Linum trigynum]
MDKFFEMIDEHVSDIANKDSLKLVAKTVALGANKSHVGSPVNTIVLKDRKVRAVLRKPQLRTKFKRVHNKFQKIKKNKFDVLKDDKFYHILQSEPLGGHAIPARGRLKEKQHRGWQRSLPHPPCSRKNLKMVSSNTLRCGDVNHVEKSNANKVGMTQQDRSRKSSPKFLSSGQGGKFGQARQGVATPVLMRNKSATSGGQGGKANAKRIPNSRGILKGATLLCDRCKSHVCAKQSTNVPVDEKSRRSYYQPHGESAKLTKLDQSRQAMSHDRIGKTKVPKNGNVLSRDKNSYGFLVREAKIRPNQDRGVSNKDVRARRTGDLQANIDSKTSKPTRVKPAVMNHGLYGWLVWFDPWSWQWVWTFGMMVYAKV